MKTIIIKHVDGKTNVKANVLMFGKSINLEWELQGLTYGRELTLSEAYELGIIENKQQKYLDEMSSDYNLGIGFI
jgi:hypothetical protein